MKKVVLSGMIGNALEWYDYALYAQFVVIIGQNFLPSRLDEDIRNIITLAIFASGFIIRPIGGVLLGAVGDKFGRKAALLIGILSMAIPTAGLGLLPSYDSIGIAAPIILVLIRLLQGFALGGEFSGCIAYIVEHSKPQHRALAGSAAFASMCIGMLLGVITAKALSYFMLEEELNNWGWRIPFISGLFIGLIGLRMRNKLEESPLYKAAKDNGNLSRFPLRETLCGYSKTLLLAIGIYISVTAPFYTITVFIETFMNSLGYSKDQSSIVTGAVMVTLIVVLPISASISDKIGRKPVLLTGVILLFFSIRPVFEVIGLMDYSHTLLSQIALAAIVAIYMGPVPTLLVEMFPTEIRFTGIALSYNLSAAIFGGSAPFLGSLLVELTEDKYIFAYYLMLLCLLSFISICFYRETYKTRL